jgi:ribonuclease E
MAAAEAPRPPTVKPVSPAAEVEQDDDTIVIRFPSAAPTAPARGDETAKASGDAARELSPNDAAMEPPIDWEAAEQPAAISDEGIAIEPPRSIDDPHTRPAIPAPADTFTDDDARAAAPEEMKEAEEAQIGKADAAPVRTKRRRRRRKKDPRLAPTKEAAQDEWPEAKEERQRPEPAVKQADAAEPAAEEKPARRRRRRSRRGRKQPSAAALPKAKDEAAVAADTKPEPHIETSKTPAPSGQKEMIINVVPREECRIAIMENGKLQEIYLERASAENYVGNIYKGIVTNVEPSIQAAFIDFGLGKNGFLHVSDLHPEYFPNGQGNTENVGRKMPRRSRPPIQRCLRRGQQLLVQITKEGIGTKGPTLTTYLSIPGRFLVMMPGMRQLGVSRKIEDEEARRKLRSQLLDLELPDNMGFIARTAALDRTKRELQSDLSYLSRLWKAVQKRIESQKAPAEIYTESDLVIRTIRDVYTSDIARIVVDDHDVAERAHDFLSIFSPRSRDTVVEYDRPEPIFHRYGIEAELERLHSRHVPLKSGGSLVIDQTEALVAIDVNSGRFRTEDDAETTAYKINLEAADEIPRQLRLRDLGGVVICDFIDMRQEKHKREIERRLTRNLKEHKERAKLLRMSDFGIIELTRQRQRASLTRSVYQDCRYCRGTGLVKTAESVTLDVMRLIQLAVTRENIRTIEVSVSAEVAHLLQNRKRAQLHELERKNRRSISIRTDPSFGLDEIQIEYRDPRSRVVTHP